MLNSICEECNELDCLHDMTGQDSVFDTNNDSECPKDKHRGLHVANSNICHLKPKLDEIKILLNSASNLDLLGMCETFLDENTGDNILHMDGFNFERKD